MNTLTPADRELAARFTFGLEPRPGHRSIDEVRVEFIIDRHRVTLDELLDANEDDPAFCAWARAAKPGDRFLDIQGVECVLEGELTEEELEAEGRLLRYCNVCHGNGYNCPECSGWEN